MKRRLDLPSGASIVFVGPDDYHGTEMTLMVDDYDIATSFDSPESSNIERADYDVNTRTLRVYFKRGETYRCGDFPLKAWEEFYNAQSKGKHFNTRIRSLYALKKE
jgi:hypothetical protein